MKKLVELLGQQPCDGDVGVEIECEGAGITASNSLFWHTERDGSLRGEFPEGAAEFVMRKPVHIDHVELALDSLIEEQKNAKFNFSFRTSVHVHVNVQQLTEPEMLAFLYLCLLVEEPLMNFCGETRKANRFCLRYADAEGFDRTLDDLFNNGCRSIRRFEGDKIRYAAINVHALRKYGSIEFRGMRGNMDKDILLPWCQTLIHLRETAKALGTPVAVFNKYIAMGNAEFVEEALGPHADKFNYATQQKDVEKSFSLTIDLPHIFKARREAVEPDPVLPRYRREVPVAPQMAPQHVFDGAMIHYHKWLGDQAVERVLDKQLDVFMGMFEKGKAEWIAQGVEVDRRFAELARRQEEEQLVEEIQAHLLELAEADERNN